MNKDEHKIRQLLDRFMAGKTTVDEERLIGEWFHNHPNAAPDLEPYRLMFDYFEQGMPLGAYGFGTTDGSGEAHEQPSSRSRRTYLWRTIGIAASLLLLVGVSLTFFSGKGRGNGEPQKGSATQIATTAQPSDSIKPMVEKPDSIRRQTIAPKEGFAKKQPRKHREMPPKPATYMAANTAKAQQKAQDNDTAKAQMARLNGEITLNMLQGEMLFNQLVASMAYYDEAEEEQNITY